MRFRIFSLFCCVASPFCLASGVFQPNAYGQFPGDPPAVETSDELPSRPDPLIQQLESDASRGGRHRARAIRSLARLGAWPQVDRWISKIDAVADQDQLAESAGMIGNEILLRISLQPELSDAGRSAISKMLAAAKAVHQSPARLKAAIDQLGGEDVDANLGANRVLMAGGQASIQEIVAAIAKGLPDSQRGKVIAVLQSLGEGGAQALGQLALYGDPNVRATSLDALRRLDPEGARDAMLVAAFADDATQPESQVARAGSAIPAGFEKLDAIAVLADRLSSRRAVAMRTPNDADPAFLWSVDETRTGVVPSRSTQIFLQYREAYDAAQRLRRLGDLPPSVSRAVLAADVAYRVMVDLDWPDESQSQQIQTAYPLQTELDALLKSLAQQRARQDVPAAVGLVRLIAAKLQGADPTQSALALRQGRYSELVDAVRDQQPRIRYESAACIADLLPSQSDQASFPGASYFRQTLSEMASLSDQRTAILIETRPVIALRQESILGQLGFEVRLVKTALDAEREIGRGGDFGMVVSKIEISDAVAAELVDRVRRQPKGSRIPIVFYSDAETNEKSVKKAEWETTSNRWISESTPAVYLVPLPGSPAALSEVLVEAESKRRLPALSIGDRSRFRMIGAAALQGESAPR